MSRLLSVTLALVLALGLAACDSSEPDPPPPPPPPSGPAPPTFSIASIPVTCDDGSACLQFAGTPSASVTLTEVVVTNPVGQFRRYSPQNAVVLQGEAAPLQEANIAFTRISGTWTFKFIGAHSPAVTNGAFDVTTTLNVGAVAPEGPAN